MKTGHGFRTWPAGAPDAARERLLRFLGRQVNSPWVRLNTYSSFGRLRSLGLRSPSGI
jgi:hypothetical protein